MISFAFAATAIVAATGAAGPAVPSIQSPEASPSLLWRGVRRVNVLCVLRTDSSGRLASQARLCEQARAAAARNAPVPINVVELGDPAVLAADAATLLVHAAVQPGGRLLAFTARPFRVSAEQTSELFGAAPRAVTLGDDRALGSALADAVAELLPWQARPPGPRPIR